MKKRKPSKLAGIKAKIESNRGDYKGLDYNPKHWGEELKENTVSKLVELQQLIHRVDSYPKEWIKEEEEFYRLVQKLNKAKTISKITLYGSKGAIDIDGPSRILSQAIKGILNSFNGLEYRIPKNGNPGSILKELLENGGYSLIMELKQDGLKDQFLVDFIQDSIKTSENKTKVKITSLQSFKQALSSFKKQRG